MKHISEDQLVDLVDGETPSEVETHLDECDRCRSRVDTLARQLDDLRDIARESVDDAELHRLLVLFRRLGPAKRGGATDWLARLVRSSSSDPAPAAVRGVASGQLMEYDGGSHTVLLRAGARGSRPTVTVVGQIEPTAESGELGGTFSLTDEDGHVLVSDVDRFGEFQLDEVAPGRYSGAWWIGDRILVIPRIEIGIDDAS